MTPPAQLLVSVHLPKTAGTSFADALARRYGDALHRDYEDLPMQVPRGKRELRALCSVPRRRCIALAPGIRAVHGHVLPVAYRLAARGRETRFITWLRDPLQRVISHYHYWRRDYDGSDTQQPLRNRMLHENWSLERFCLGPEMRNLYRQYLWGFDPNAFDFIGLTERYPSDVQHLLGEANAGAEARLANPDRGDQYPIAPDLEVRMRKHHAADMRLYEWVAAGRPGRFGW